MGFGALCTGPTSMRPGVRRHFARLVDGGMERRQGRRARRAS